MKSGRRRRRGERGVRDAWRLPPVCHKNGKHVMIANAEQIGLEKQSEERAGGAETDGIVGPMPAIPTHDGAGQAPLLQCDTCCWRMFTRQQHMCEHKRGKQYASPHFEDANVSGEHFSAFIYVIVFFIFSIIQGC